MSAAVGPVYVDVSVVRTIADRRGDLWGWHPWDVTHNPVSGHILVTDYNGHCIRVFSDNPPYAYITQYGRRGKGEGEYYGPMGITCDSEGRVIVADCINRRLQVLSSTGQYRGQVTGIRKPWWVCVDGEDNMYVKGVDDNNSDNTRVYNPQGEPLPSITRRGEGYTTISGEQLYQVNYSKNHRHIRIHSLTDQIDDKTVPLPQHIPNMYSPRITACRDGCLLITAQGWSADAGADVSDDDYDVIDEDTTYIYILDGAGHNLTPRPYRYEGRPVETITLLYDNTLVVMDKERRVQLVTLPRLDPPLRPLHPVRVASLKNLCLYKIRSKVNTADDIHTLAPDIGKHLEAELSRLYI